MVKFKSYIPWQVHCFKNSNESFRGRCNPFWSSSVIFPCQVWCSWFKLFCLAGVEIKPPVFLLQIQPIDGWNYWPSKVKTCQNLQAVCDPPLQKEHIHKHAMSPANWHEAKHAVSPIIAFSGESNLQFGHTHTMQLSSNKKDYKYKKSTSFQCLQIRKNLSFFLSKQ